MEFSSFFRYNGVVLYEFSCDFQLTLLQKLEFDAGIWDFQFSDQTLDILVLQDKVGHLQVLHANDKYLKRSSIFQLECETYFKGIVTS